MNKSTFIALGFAMEKWDNIRCGLGVDKGSDNCALCKVFQASGCIGCPVFKDTGKIACTGTPYVDWCEHQIKEHGDGFDVARKVHEGCAECKRLADNEWEYIRYLLIGRE